MKNLLTLISIFICVATTAQTSDSATFYFNKGVEEQTAKRFLVASKHFETSLSLNPNNIDALLASGYTNLEMRKTNAALQNFEKVNQLAPTNEIAIQELITLYFAYKNYNKAVQFANKCKTCTNSERIIAISYYQDENYGLAEKALSAYLAKNPNDAEANFSLARTYLELDNEMKAIQHYEAAIKLDTTKSSWSAELGLIYYNNNQHQKAIASFKNAMQHGFPQSNDFKENLGFSYIYARQPQNAEPILQDLIVRKAGNKELLRDAAEAYYISAQYDNSLQYCQKLMEMDPKDGKALYQAGLCFQKKGEKDRGQKMCDTAIEMDPSLKDMRKQTSFQTGM